MSASALWPARSCAVPSAMRASVVMIVTLFTTLVGVAPRAALAAPIVPVRTLYLVPSDRVAVPEYTSAIDAALLDLQGWFAGELGGATFGLATPSVEVVVTSHPASYYSTTAHPFEGDVFDFFFNVLDEALTLGVQLDDPSYRWAVYIDADPAPGQQGGAALSGVTIIGAEDLRGLTGQTSLPVGRWIGGLGHELGHTFGLPHPLDCVGPTAPPGCVYGPLDYPSDVIGGALMQFGYLMYPDTYLLAEEREFLLSTPYIGVPDQTAVIPEPGTFTLLLLGVLAGRALRSGRAGA
jgi:hypothetical protein